MHAVRYDLRLDAYLGGSQASVVVKHGDVRSRLLRMRLYNGSTQIPLAADQVCVLKGVKPDGTVIFNDCEVADGAALVTMTAQLMAVPGAVECELTVYGPDMEVLTSPRFDIYVEDVLYPDGIIESRDEYTGLTEAMGRLAALEKEVEGNEESREELYLEVKEAYESGALDGEPGEAATIAITETKTVPHGTPAAFEELPGSTAQARKYRAAVPVGKPGADGEAATIEIVETRTGAEGTKAIIEDAAGSTARARKLIVTIPVGVQGKDGTGVNILGSYDAYEELAEAKPVGAPGDAYLVQGDLYVWSANTQAWVNVGSIQGPVGKDGIGVPQGGSNRQSLLKVGSSDYATAWGDLVPSDVGAEPAKLQYTDVPVPTSAWTQSSDTNYPHTALIPLDDVTADMVPKVVFSAADASSGLYSPVAMTVDGGVEIYAREVPGGDITVPTILCWQHNPDAPNHITSTVPNLAASRWDFMADGNPVRITPAAGSRAWVMADKDCTVLLTGANLLNASSVAAKYGCSVSADSDTFTVTATATGANQGAYLRTVITPGIFAGRQITIRANWRTSGTNVGQLTLLWLNASNAPVSGGDVRIVTSPGTYTNTLYNIPTGAAYLALLAYSNTSATTVGSYVVYERVQIEVGASATPFEPFAGSSTYHLTANTPTEIAAIPGINNLSADNSAFLRVGYNRDSMDLLHKDLTVPVSATGAVAQLKGLVGGLELDVTARAVATQEGSGNPSPDNVRPITGKTAIHVTRYGDDPSTGHTYPVTLPEELFGLPGAEDEIDWARGVVTKRTKLLTLTGTENWTEWSAGSGVLALQGLYTPNLGSTTIGKYICNILSPTTATNVNNKAYPNTFAIYHTSGYMLVYAPGYPSISAWKLYLGAQYAAGTPVQVLYELATPQIITIDPITIPSLSGVNTVYTDAGGDTTVTGRMGALGLLGRIEAIEKAIAGV